MRIKGLLQWVPSQHIHNIEEEGADQTLHCFKQRHSTVERQPFTRACTYTHTWEFPTLPQVHVFGLWHPTHDLPAHQCHMIHVFISYVFHVWRHYNAFIKALLQKCWHSQSHPLKHFFVTGSYNTVCHPALECHFAVKHYKWWAYYTLLCFIKAL